MIPRWRRVQQTANSIHFALCREPIGQPVTGHEAVTLGDLVGTFGDHFVRLRRRVQPVDPRGRDIQWIWIRNRGCCGHRCSCLPLQEGPT